MTTFNDFQDYIEGITTDVTDIEYVQLVVDWLEIMDLQLDFVKYPCLVVEVPDVNVSDVGGAALEFDFAWSVIKPVPQDEKPEFAKTVLSEMLEIALKVQKQIFCDSEENEEEFDAELGSQLQRIVKATADNCYGWRGFAKIKIYRSI